MFSVGVLAFWVFSWYFCGFAAFGCSIVLLLEERGVLVVFGILGFAAACGLFYVLLCVCVLFVVCGVY